ncbi:MAG: aspartate-semialdehyde dehydrogenase [Holosporales bacterium]|jgi:aspartate-semialdehyde dehydrogenase|nr:aspartate-semialdehyde dehydrogenase [Holosporales bacterium]
MPYFQEKTFAVVGVTGLVGQEFLKILLQNGVPASNVKAIASSKSINQQIQYGAAQLTIQGLDDFDFTQCQIGLFSPGASVSAQYAPRAVAAGCVVIDNTSFFRMVPDVPLIVPEINANELVNAKRGIIANPNCSTIQLVMALHPIRHLSKIKKVIVATYQSVSGAGKDAIMELRGAGPTAGTGPACGQANAVFPQGIRGNLIPQIDVFLSGGCTKEEWKMDVETKKIFNESIDVIATCVRVPVEYGHSEAVCFELEENVPLSDIHAALRAAPGVCVADLEANVYHTPKEIAGTDVVFVSRLRQDLNTGLYQMWVVADNIRKGAALNAVQIAQQLIVQRDCIGGVNGW